jgi:hypothetical protein
MVALHVTTPHPTALAVAEAAFLGLQRGAATGDWDGFVDLLADDVRIMIPVPAHEANPPEGLLVGKDIARQMFASHHQEQVSGVKLECKRVAANGSLVVIESRVEGGLGGELAANHFVFAFEVAGSQIAAMYEYSSWTAKNDDSGWGDLAFAREAFPDTLIDYDESRFAAEPEVPTRAPIRLIQIGLDPDKIDFSSPDFAMFPGLTAEKLRAANDANLAGLRELGFEVDMCFVDFGETATEVVGGMVSSNHYDGALVGAGIRIVASNTELFEAIINVIHSALPDVKFVFNQGPKATPEDLFRWFPQAAR